MDSTVQGQVAPPNLRNIAQHGGTYQQVLDCGTYMLAVRTGGVEVLLQSSGQWKSVSHLPLSSIPVLYENEHGVFARFKSRLLKIGIDDAYRLHVLSDEILPTNFTDSRPPAKTIHTQGALFSISDPNKGLRIKQDDGKESTCMFSGYSRPSSLALSRGENELLVADVGAIHSVNVANEPPTVSDRMCLPGWPKDIACDEVGVYCANVLGVRWYRETKIYPYLEEIDKLSHLHFRMAKVIADKGRIVACDEVRGLHFFAAQDGRLQARGGLMLDGGAWDCNFFNGQLLVATGDEGWITAPFEWETLKVGQSIRHRGTGRVHSVVAWPAANRYVILSDKGIRMRPMKPCSESDSCVEDFPDISSWGAVAIGRYLVVAAARKGLLLLIFDESLHVTVCSQVETVEARDVCFDGNFIWLADGRGGVRCYTLDTQTSRLNFLGVFPVAGFCRGVVSTVSRLYVGAGDGGLVVLTKKKGLS